MSWREALQPASFRGVDFFVQSQSTTGGRRLQLHEFPLRDEPYSEDLGRKARHFNLECYLLGQGYIKDRDLLEEALEAEGPATLVIPWRGSVQVAVEEYQLRESSKEGGLARFTVKFCDAGQPAQPDTTLDTSWQVEQAATLAESEAQADFAREFGVGGLPQWLSSSALDTVFSALGDVRVAAAAVALPVTLAQHFLATTIALESEVDSLLLLPSSLASRLCAVVAALAGEDNSWGSVARCRALFGYANTAIPTTSTPLRYTAATNSQAVATLVERTALIQAVTASANLNFETYDQAAALRQELGDALDDAAATAPDPVYVTLTNLRVAMIQDITAQGANLARLTSWTPAVTLPSLVVAHAIYGDATREGEIVSRNRIRHPGAVPGGVPLEVLTNV